MSDIPARPRGYSRYARNNKSDEPVRGTRPWDLRRIPTPTDMSTNRRNDPLPEASPYWKLRSKMVDNDF